MRWCARRYEAVTIRTHKAVLCAARLGLAKELVAETLDVVEPVDDDDDLVRKKPLDGGHNGATRMLLLIRIGVNHAAIEMPRGVRVAIAANANHMNATPAIAKVRGKLLSPP